MRGSREGEKVIESKRESMIEERENQREKRRHERMKKRKQKSDVAEVKVKDNLISIRNVYFHPHAQTSFTGFIKLIEFKAGD